MSTKTRFILLALTVLIAAGGLLFVLSRSESSDPEPAASQPIEDVPETQPAQVAETLPSEEPIADAVAPLAEPAEEVEETSVTKGRARIHGTVTAADGGPIPGDMQIAITRYPESPTDIPTFDRLKKSTTLDAEGKFAFEELPYGYYAVFAESATYTGNSSANLSRERRESERTITLYPAATISGVVVDPDGQPVPEATVYAGAYVQSGNEVSLGMARSFGTETKTDAQGNFVVSSLQFREPPIQYRLLAQADGYASHNSEILQPNATDVRLILSPGSFASGYAVHRDTGEAVPDLKLYTQTNAILDQKSVSTDTEGWFILGPLEPGSYDVFTKETNWLIVPETAKFQMAEGNDTDNLNVAFLMGGVITGRVYDADTNRGIAGVQIDAYGENNSGARGEAETDSKGVYRIDGLKEATYQMQYRDVKGYPDHDYNEQRKITVSLAQEFDGVDFPLSRGITISGIVVDEEGTPIKEAYINGSARRNNRSETRGSARTAENGRFTLAGFSTGQSVRVSASASDKATDPMEAIAIGDTHVTGIRIVMGPGGSISGTVVDDTGKPVARGDIMYARVENGGKAVSRSTRNFSSGTFDIGQLRAGTYKLIAGPDQVLYRNDSINDPKATTVTVAPGEKMTGIRVAFIGSTGMSVSGRVVDEQGQPVASAQITSYSTSYQQTASGADGTFTITGLSSGNNNLQVQHNSYTNKSQTAEGGATNVKIILQAAASVSGVVLDKITGRPVQDFELMIERGDNAIRPDNYRNFSRRRSDDGSFTVDSVQAGTNMLAVRGEGFAKTELRLENLLPGEVRNDVVVYLEAGNLVVGRVVNSQGQPVNDAMIFVGELPDRSLQRAALTTTAGSGEFKLDSVPSGSTTLYAAHSDYATGSQTVNIRTGIENRADIQLPIGSAVEGFITENGKPLASMNVFAQGITPQTSRQQKNSKTDEKGYYHIGGLPEGTVMVHLNIPQASGSNRSLNNQVTVTDGMATRQDFDIMSATSSIEGVITVDGKPAEQGHVNMSITKADGSTESNYVQLQPDSAGYYLIENLPAGEVSLGVYVQGYSQKRVTVMLAENRRERRDIEMLSGTTLTCDLRNLPADTIQSIVYVLTGEVDIPAELNMTFFQSLNSQMAGAAAAIDGVVTITGLEPGSYTLLAAAVVGERDPENPFSNMVFVKQGLKISNEKNMNITIGF